MSNAFFKVPEPVNEPVLSYAPGSPERQVIQERLAAMQAQEIEVPLYIGGQAVKTGDVAEMRAPHDHSIKLGVYHKAGEREVRLAIEAALDARARSGRPCLGSIDCRSSSRLPSCWPASGVRF